MDFFVFRNIHLEAGDRRVQSPFIFEQVMKEEKRPIDPKVLEEITEAIEKMKHGQVIVTVYDSKVVQIEEVRKKRFK